MNGISFQLDEKTASVDVVVKPLLVNRTLDSKALLRMLKDSPYKHYYVFDENIISVIESCNQARIDINETEIKARIAEKRPAVIKYRIEEKDMVAFIKVVAAYGDENPTYETLRTQAEVQGVLRGISTKTLKNVAKQLESTEAGAVIEELVAKGLPVRNGKDSKIKPLVPNALERILQPQSSGSTRVDMRNLGDVICVKAGTKVLKRIPPTKGRNGFTVTDIVLEAKAGNWIKMRPGEGIVQSETNDNLYLAAITGMPKYKNGKMWVDDTYVCKGVNIGTGNVVYDGAVIVNGDVTEKMIINASGDVTINGFVESAQISAGGDIIITEGAMGKVDESATEFSTLLAAEGSIHVQHGQGLNIKCKGNVTVGRQIAYSKIVCAGTVTVGPIDNPNGNLFACDVQCNATVVAGTLGAVSGSHLTVDFSAGYNSLMERKDTIDDLLAQVKNNNSRHQDKFELIRSKKIHPELRKRFDEAEEMLNSESQLMDWLQTKADKMQREKDNYQLEIKLVANKKLHNGVVVKLNNRTWRAEREYGKAKVVYEGHQWNYQPLI